MTRRFQNRGRRRAAALALMFELLLLAMPTRSGAEPDVPGFTVSVDSAPVCLIDAPVNGTVTLIGLTTGYEFEIQLRGDGTILDHQTFDGHDWYPDGGYAWSMTSALAASHDVLELSFTLEDSRGNLIRDEAVALNPDCGPASAGSSASPVQSIQQPVTIFPSPHIPHPEGSPRPAPAANTRAIPAAEVEDDGEPDVRLVFGITAGTVLVLSALAALDRRPEP